MPHETELERRTINLEARHLTNDGQKKRPTVTGFTLGGVKLSVTNMQSNESQDESPICALSGGFRWDMITIHLHNLFG